MAWTFDPTDFDPNHTDRQKSWTITTRCHAGFVKLYLGGCDGPGFSATNAIKPRAKVNTRGRLRTRL